MDLPAPVKALVVVLNLPLVPIVALIAGINQLATHWDSAWSGIRSVTQAVVNTVLSIVADLMGAVAWMLDGLAKVADKIPDWVPRAHAAKEALHGMAGAAYDAAGAISALSVNLFGSVPAFNGVTNASWNTYNALKNLQAVSQFNIRNAAEAPVRQGYHEALLAVNADLNKNIMLEGQVAAVVGNYVVPALDAGAGAAGGAAKALDDTAKAALEAHKAFVTLIGTTTLYDVMAAEATVTELRLADAGVERKNLLEAEIGILQRNLDALKGTGDANDILRDSIQGTIDKLQAQVDAVDDATHKWKIFGADGMGPVTAAINAMNDAISEQTGGIQGLLSVQTQEEADLVARIANYDAQIAGLEAVTAATEALTEAEQLRLGHAKGTSESASKEIELIEDYMATIDEMARRKKLGPLTEQEIEASNLALVKLNRLEKAHGDLTAKNVHEKMQERIWDLQQESESADETVTSLNDLATARGKEGDAAIKALEAERDPLQKQLDAIKANKDAVVAGVTARSDAFPTYEQWLRFVVGEGIQQGIITDGVLAQIPALHDWATTHGQTVFDIAKGLQLLELAQNDFLLDTTTLLGDWTTQWAEAAALVAASMASVGGEAATPAVAVPALQGGGYIRRGGLALLHAGELVTPARSVRGAATTVINQDIHVGEQGVFMGDTYAMKKLAEWMRAQGFIRKQDLS
jgi:hypothetical protein